MALLMRAATIAWLLVAGMAQADQVTEGEALPRLTLADRNGDDVELRGDAAPLVIVEFWASWCAPCRTMLPAVVALAAEHADRVHLFAVNIDRDADKAAAFVRDYLRRVPASVTLLHDPEAAAMARFGAQGMPAVFAAEDGIVRLVLAGAQPDMEQRLRQFVERSEP